MSAGATSPRIYTLPEIERATSTPSFRSDLIDAIAAAFAQYSSGGFNACPIQTMGAPPMARLSCASDDRYAAQVCVKSGYVTGAEHFVVKVAAFQEAMVFHAAAGSRFAHSGTQAGCAT